MATHSERIPTKIREVMTCSICLDLMNDSNKHPMSAPCGHSFSKDCVDNMYKTKPNESFFKCPLCRKKCDREDVVMN